jgi:hypothetical protein
MVMATSDNGADTSLNVSEKVLPSATEIGAAFSGVVAPG